MRRLAFPLVAFVLSVFTLVGTAPAQNGLLTKTYDVMPKNGMEAQFEAALRAHSAFRMANGDPWEWSVFTYETGPNMGGYHIRSGGHDWADFDAYDTAMTFGAAALAHWNSTMAPLVESITSKISRADTSMSQYPADWSTINFVTVSTYHVPPAMREQFFANVKTAHTSLKAGGWTNAYGWSFPVSGGSSGEVQIAGFHTNWADMTEPSPNFGEVMTKQIGEKKLKEWTAAFLATFTGASSETLRWRRDLSVTK